MKSVLLNLQNFKIIASDEGEGCLLRLEYLADILIPRSDFFIGIDEQSHLDMFTSKELFMIAKANKIGTPRDLAKAETLIHEFCQRMDTQTASLEELKEQLGRPLSSYDTAKPRKEVKPVAAMKAPATGTTSRKVWDIAEGMNNNDPGLGSSSKEFRMCVIEECIKDGINKATASTQFSKWRKDLDSR